MQPQDPDNLQTLPELYKSPFLMFILFKVMISLWFWGSKAFSIVLDFKLLIKGFTFSTCFVFSLFIKSNQGDEETTKVNYFTFIGTPVQATNMNDFKRVRTNVKQHYLITLTIIQSFAVLGVKHTSNTSYVITLLF